MASSPHHPHVALIPSAGMGHLIPFLRLSAMLAARGCAVSIIAAHPTVSATESDHLSAFFAAYPRIKRIDFHLLPYKKSNFINEDPFFIQFEAIDKSTHLLRPVLSSLSPPLSAVVSDLLILRSIAQITEDLSIPTYTLITTSARFFCLMVNLSLLLAAGNVNGGTIDVPGLGQVPVSSIPPPMLNPNHFFSATITENTPPLPKLKGILLNTFTWFESEAIEALNSSGLAPILPVGPLQPLQAVQGGSNLPWLDQQAQESVLFISFGSRTALSKEQIRELGAGLEKSGCNFLWVLKGSKVDKEDNQEVEELIGEGFLERTQSKGLVVKGWVDQDQVLGHPSIGGFMSHCGWNSVMEAARLGVPILAWPLHGDQKINAEVVEKIGLGLWSSRDWGWGGQKLVGRDEIADKIMEVMMDKKVRDRAKQIKEKACLVRDANGDTELKLQEIIQSCIKET
ncbi:UDP-glycosyltransferase 708G1-like [Andrographis paniculata]|uniref:UDP-glycosyltransferase 708G1-like n=1 Tax=Andrographis paniculata TaxID=175694 RepID=UPI0021E808AF|nr:UDP-glycosyltransferase 708G1-like [Andrographis paniculata]